MRWDFDIHLTANLPRNLPVKNFLNRLRIDKIMVMSLWPRFLVHPVFSINATPAASVSTAGLTVAAKNGVPDDSISEIRRRFKPRSQHVNLWTELQFANSDVDSPTAIHVFRTKQPSSLYWL